jgi:hypothetical protein
MSGMAIGSRAWAAQRGGAMTLREQMAVASKTTLAQMRALPNPRLRVVVRRLRTT